MEEENKNGTIFIKQKTIDLVKDFKHEMRFRSYNETIVFMLQNQKESNMRIKEWKKKNIKK